MNEKSLINIIKRHYPDIEAIYLFGSAATGELNKNSDLDIALLLPEEIAEKTDPFFMSPLRFELETLLKREIDLINLRIVSTVFQKEIIAVGKRIYCINQYQADKFEMLTLSYYQKLNEERSEILEEFYNTKRAYPV